MPLCGPSRSRGIPRLGNVSSRRSEKGLDVHIATCKRCDEPIIRARVDADAWGDFSRFTVPRAHAAVLRRWRVCVTQVRLQPGEWYTRQDIDGNEERAWRPGRLLDAQSWHYTDRERAGWVLVLRHLCGDEGLAWR